MNIFKVNGAFSARKLITSLLVTFIAALIGGLFAMHAGDIYTCLLMPSFAPPAWLFGPVWIVLYFLMGLSFYRIRMYGPETPGIKGARQYYYLQLLFNILWSVLFFGFSMRFAAFADLLILLFYIIMTTIRFFKIDKTAGWLMVPYLLWTIFAGVLNLAIVLLNG